MHEQINKIEIDMKLDFICMLIHFYSFSKNYMLSEIVPRPNSFYFIETSGSSQFGPRVACSIESAAKHHPNDTIVSQNRSFFILKKKLIVKMTI